MILQRYVALLLLLITTQTHAAALMGFEESAMLMVETNRFNQEVMLNYSPKIGHALGFESMRMHSQGEPDMVINALNYTGLIKRWNYPSAQANLWFSGGLGEVNSQNNDGLAYTPSIQLDAESTRLYFLAKARLIRTPEQAYDTAAVQAGFSFYETSFDETQPWFVVEAKAMRNFSPGLQITPALRLINKNYFLEIGVTNPFENTQTAKFNLMLTF